MAYITRHTYEKLLSRVNLDEQLIIDKEVFKSWIFSDSRLFHFFNQEDLKGLLKEILVRKGIKNTFLVYKEEVESDDTDSNLVYDFNSQPCYHSERNCSRLIGGYNNFKMPEFIKHEKSDRSITLIDLKDELISWFRANDFTLNGYRNNEFDNDAITKKFNEDFCVKYDIEFLTLRRDDINYHNWYFHIPSSGVLNIDDSFNKKVFKSKINHLIHKRESLCKDYQIECKAEQYAFKSLSRFDFLKDFSQSASLYYFKNNKLDRLNIDFISINYEVIKKFWLNHFQLKIEAKKLLNEYIKWNYNLNEVNYDELTLESFGIRRCMSCYNSINDSDLDISLPEQLN